MISRQILSVGDLFELENGFAFKSRDFIDQGVPVIKIKNVKAGFFSEHEFSYVSDKFLTERANKLAKPQDLLISMSGNRHDGSPETWVGKVAFFDRATPYFLNQRVGALRLKKEKQASIRFMGYLLSSFPYQEQFIAIATSSGGQANLSPAQILSAEIDIPNIEEQLEIAAILGALDDKIEVNRKTAATLEELAQALYRSWFVDFDPVHAKAAGRTPAHMDAATAALFPDSFGENGLPEGWEQSTVSAVCEHVKQTVKPMDQPDQPFHHFSLPAFDTGRVPVLENGKDIKSNKLFVPNNAILFSRLNPSISRVWWAQTDEEAAIPASSTEFYVAKALHELQTPWLYCLMSSANFRDEALFRVTGTSNSHQRVPPKAFAEIEVIKPTDGLLQAFGEVCGNWFERIHAMSEENQTLAALRDTLLPRLMSGELRVGEAKEQVEAIA
ncbi:restriction endonuclease subunit S [Aliiroseovarius lamellibrachiae]|uniref:restriction endonuclease subunit S n=1 Tax=Aliiroseovarius lamellibrachiae TaxID=1924933 RepID=UPI001BE07129|nr:restriction endonuclease subunit S [Aliiroseovarius lamellibrachiae]MBT2131005.1 restriction endonuclease subunit S [Aliiroseovarius lamellibrachiae]